MKIAIMDKTGKELKKKDLPSQFDEYVRDDIIKKACEVIIANKRQPYGADDRAGKDKSADLSRRRHNYRGSYGHGISRVPRKILTRKGTQMHWVGAVAPGTVGGRKAHPPKADKIWDRKINKKERRLAIRSAIAASMQKELVSLHGHKVPEKYPFILDNSFETIIKTKEITDALINIGLKDEIERCKKVTLIAGKARLRGRGRKTKTGPLIVIANDCKLLNSASNILGVEIIKVTDLNAMILAPGFTAGRLTLFTESAIDRMAAEKLFTDDVKIAGVVKKEKKMPIKKEIKKSKSSEVKKKKTVSKPVEKKSEPKKTKK